MATKFHSSSRSDEVPVQARFLELVETLGVHVLPHHQDRKRKDRDEETQLDR
jgi:hypothetical protein